MDPHVPSGAAILLDFIAIPEVGTAGPEGYGVIYGNKQGRLPKPLTEMTLDEVQAAQGAWSKNHGSSAAGRYQFMRATLKDLISQLGLRGSQTFSADLQDRLGYELLKRRGYLQFAAGTKPLRQFGNDLAKEWASLPVLTDIQGQKRAVIRGETYYAGDGINKVQTTPEKVEDVLAKALVIRVPDPRPVDPAPPAPDPKPPRTGKGWGFIGWSIFWLIVAATLVTLAFTIRF